MTSQSGVRLIGFEVGSRVNQTRYFAPEWKNHMIWSEAKAGLTKKKWQCPPDFEPCRCI